MTAIGKWPRIDATIALAEVGVGAVLAVTSLAIGIVGGASAVGTGACLLDSERCVNLTWLSEGFGVNNALAYVSGVSAIAAWALWKARDFCMGRATGRVNKWNIVKLK